MAFWSKKKTEPTAPAAPPLQARVTRIPDVFYGGANPVVYADTDAKSESSVVPKAITVESQNSVSRQLSQTHRQDVAKMIQEEALEEVAQPVPPNEDVGLVQPPQKGRGRLLFWVGGGLTIIVLGGISWWYVARSLPEQPNTSNEPLVVVPEPVPIPPPVAPEPVIVPPPVASTSSEMTVPTTSPSRELPLVFPLTGLVDAEDVDKDTLTDIEEEVFRTDSGTWDSDADGYFDGQEVVNLYNPSGFAPVKIIDSGLVREFVHPENTWRLFYPSAWDVGIVDTAATQVLVSSVTGDFIEIRTMTKLPGETFEMWFGRVALSQRFSDINRKTNRFMEEIFVRQDGLVAYKDTPNKVYVLLYRQGSADTVLYRHVMEMVYQSFRPEKSAVETAEQPRIPEVGN